MEGRSQHPPQMQRACCLPVLLPSPGSSKAAQLPIASPPPLSSTNILIYSVSACVPGPTMGPGDGETKLFVVPAQKTFAGAIPRWSLWSQAWSMKSHNLTPSHVATPELSFYLYKVSFICCNIIFVRQVESEKMPGEYPQQPVPF